MGQVGNGLNDPLIDGGPQLVDQKRQGDLCRNGGAQGQQADLDGVAEDPLEIRVGKEPLEVLETHPGTLVDAFHQVEVLESHLDSIHGHNFEDEEIREDRNHHQPDGQILVPHRPGPQAHMPLSVRTRPAYSLSFLGSFFHDEVPLLGI